MARIVGGVTTSHIPAIGNAMSAGLENADEGWGLQTLTSFDGDAEFSWHLAESLINQDFDMTTCQEMLVDHGFIVPMALMWRHLPTWPMKGIPIHGPESGTEDSMAKFFREPGLRRADQHTARQSLSDPPPTRDSTPILMP